jgi:diacylglycerol O-acyltransferase
MPGRSPLGPARRPIDPVDTIWLNMDRANNLMVIESLMTLEDALDRERFLRVFERRVLDRYPVFRQRPVRPRWSLGMPLGMPHWEDDPDFSLSRHIHHATLDPPGDDVALQDYVNTFISTPLERDKPLWEVHLVDGYGAGSAIYSRLHHSLADGIALTRVLLSLSDGSPGADLDEVDPDVGPARGLVGTTVHLAELTGAALLGLPRLLTPGHAVDAFTLLRQTSGIATKLMFTRNPVSPVAGEAGVRKRAIWAAPFPLADVVETGHGTGTTVNDVLVAALAGALSTYQQDHGGTPVDVPTMVPVNVRPLDEPLPRELGNRFALVLFSLPSGFRTPFARLAETKRRMDAIKHSPEALLTFGMIRGIGRTGPDVERFLVDFFANKASGVTTNVPGPTASRFVAGTRITAMLGWAPESGDQTHATCIFTYDGQEHVGFKVDVDTIAHPEELLVAFTAEVDALQQLAGVPRPAGPNRAGRRTLTGPARLRLRSD